MTFHCTENLQSVLTSEDRTRAINTAVCPANLLAINIRSKNIKHLNHIQTWKCAHLDMSPDLLLLVAVPTRVAGMGRRVVGPSHHGESAL